MTLPEAWETLRAVGLGGALLVFILGLHRGWWVMRSEYAACTNRAVRAEAAAERWEQLFVRQLEATKSAVQIAEQQLQR